MVEDMRLRQLLESLNVSKGKDAERELSSEETELIQLLANEMHRGNDIQRTYPKAYEKLMTDPALRDAFLEVIRMMTDTSEDDLS